MSKDDAGYVVPPEDAISFADALEAAADNPNCLKAKGLNGKRLAIENFDRKMQVSDWVDVLELTYNNVGKN